MLRALRRIGQEPSLFIVIAEGEGADEFFRRFGVWRRLAGVPRFDELGVGEEGVRRLDLKLRGHGGQHFGLLLSSADALITVDQGRVLEGLNIARDSLERVARGPLVLVFSESGARTFAERAPDLYDARTMTGTFVVVPAPREHIEQPRRRTRQRLPSEIEATVRREMSSEAPIPFGSAIDVLLSVAERYRRSGNSENASRVAAECAVLSRKHGYAEGVGRSLCTHAIVNIDNLELRCSLKMAVEEALSIAREHHLDRLLVFAAECRARLYDLDGCHQDASRILQEEVVPALESLGDQSLILDLQDTAAFYSGKDPHQLLPSILRLRENLKRKKEGRSSARSIAMSQYYLAVALVRSGELSAWREAAGLITDALRKLSTTERALHIQVTSLLERLRSAIADASPPRGLNRAARRARNRR